MKITLFTLVKVAKPLKKALSSAEAFSIKQLLDILPAGHQWIVSYKADGIRCQLHKKGNKIKLYSDEANIISPLKVEELLKVARNLPDSIILDGELMLYLDGKVQEHQGIASYIHSKESRPGEVRYTIWDCLLLLGRDISKLPYSSRLEKVNALHIQEPIYKIKYAIGTTAAIPRLIDRVKSDEGAIIRAADSTYWQDNLLFKYKKTYDIDAKIVKVEKKRGGEVYLVADAEGNVLGRTFKQSYMSGKVGNIVRIAVTKIYKHDVKGKTIYTLYAPSVQVGSKGAAGGTSKRYQTDKKADTQSTLEKIYQATVGK